MGQRSIDTVLRVQNEGGYKAALRSCTAELKVMKSDLDRVTSEFRTNANSMDALTQKGNILGNMYAAQQEKMELLRGAMVKAQNTRDQEEQTIASLRNQYDEARKVLASYAEKFGKNSEEYQKQERLVSSLRDELSKSQVKLDSSTKSYSYYATQLNKASVELDDLQDKQKENQRLLEEARGSINGCATSIDRYGDAVQEAADSTEESTSAVEAMAGAMVASGIQQKVEDLAAELHECSEEAQGYEKSIAKVNTIADNAVMSQSELASSTLSLSKDLRRDADEVADAMYEALSAGVQTSKTLGFTKQSTQLAVAGFTDIGTSVDVLTTIINAYKLETEEAERVASVLVKTQDLGKITVDEFGKVVGRVIPSAAAYGVNLNNIGTAYANMTAAGINAENTTTYLSTMLDELADSGSTVAEILQEQTGKSFSQLMADGKSLADVLAIIGASVENDQVQFANLWSSATAGKAAISLFDGSAAAFNATLEEMANSSGTVAKNYEQMVSISEYSSQRLEVASKNLRIAIGTQLNPALDILRECGAAILETAAEVVSENPLLVSAITGLVTAVGALATGLSALMIVKSVTAAMAALNITLAANPVGLVAVGVAGLVAALATFVAQANAASAEVDSLTEASRSLSEATQQNNQNYEDSVAAAEGAQIAVKSYIDRLKELEEQGLATREQELEYSMILEKINALMPELNAELDEQTGLVRGGADALLEQAEAWAANAKQEALYTRYKNDVAAYADAEYELAVNRAKLNAVTKEAEIVESRMTDAQERAIELSKQQAALYDNASLSTEEFWRQHGELAQQIQAANDEYAELQMQLLATHDQQDILNEAIKVGEEVVAANTAEAQANMEAYNALSEEYAKTSESFTDNSGNMADATAEASRKMQEEYAALYGAARDSLNKQIGLFDNLSGKCEISMDEMISNLKTQQVAFENYATNIQLAMERGIDIGLIKTLSDGTVEHMQQLEILVNGTDEQIAELNKVLGGVGVSKERASANMATVVQYYSDALEKESSTFYEASFSLGANSGDGIIEGFKSRAPSFRHAAVIMANTGTDAYKRANDQHSPSKRYQQLAENDVQGLIVQYKKSKPALERQATDLADSGYLSSINARKSQIPSLVQAATTTAPAAASNSETQLVLSQILSVLKAGQRLYVNGDTMIGATADGYDSAMGAKMFLVERGAT